MSVNALLANPKLSPPRPLPKVLHDYWVDWRHFTTGRNGQSVKWLILHSSVGSDSRAWLTRTSGLTDARKVVSAHALGRRDGTRNSLCHLKDTAYHAGNCKNGITNENSLGYELENRGGWVDLSDGSFRLTNVEAYPLAQIVTAAHCFAGWLYSFGLDWSRVVTHGNVAIPYGRKRDPVAFDMEQFRREVDVWRSFFDEEVRPLPEELHGYYIY